MYDPEITQRAVEKASRRLKFDLTYHSARQISAARALLDDLIDLDRGEMKRKLNPDEQKFLTNERTLCLLDARYYYSRYAQIVNWKKEVEYFNPNVAQSLMLDVWASLERQSRAIHVVQLKARRLGVSTLSEVEVARRVQFHKHTNAVVASADPTKSVLMADMIDFCWKQMPWWMLPKTSKRQHNMPVEFDEIGTGITIQSGNQFNGVARGATPNVYHVSEIAEWVDPEELIDGALLRAIIDTPNVWGMIEGTGKGRGNYLETTWTLLKKDWPLGRARQMPVFLPWYVGTDIYPSEAEMRARPIPTHWVPSDRTIKHADRARAYVLANPLLFEHLAKNDRDWQLPRAQMWFYEVEWEAAKEKKTLNIFLAEMASDDHDAFQSSNIPVIDQEVLMNYRDGVRPPVAVYAVIGDTIPAAITVPRSQWAITPDDPPITIRIASLLPNVPLKFQLIPVRFEGYSSFDPNLKLMIWEQPLDGEEYGIGVDTSDGIGQDNTAIEVVRKATMERPDAQVAEFVSPYIKAYQLWPIVLAISTFYSVLQRKTMTRKQARLAIEVLRNGEIVQHEIRKRGWTNFHPWKSNLGRREQPDGETARVGVFTNAWFRPQMMDMILTLVDEQALEVPSQYLFSELETLERDEDQQKAKAAYGQHDDRVMALGFPLYSLHVGDRPHQQYARRRVEFMAGEPADTAVYPIWSSPAQAQSTGTQLPQRMFRRGVGRRRSIELERIVNRDMPKGFR